DRHRSREDPDAVPPARREDHSPDPHDASRGRRAAQDVRHPVGILADGEHRHHRRARLGGRGALRPGRRRHLQQLRRRHRGADDDHPPDRGDPVRDERVEPAERADDVHARAEPRPRHGSQGCGDRPGRDRLDRRRLRRRGRRQPHRLDRQRDRHRVGHGVHAALGDPARQCARHAARLRLRAAAAQLGRGDRRLPRVRAGAASAGRAPVGHAELVRRRPSLGGLQLRPRRAVRPDAERGAVGEPRDVHRAVAGAPARRRDGPAAPGRGQV
ncbi:MAG: hypothetical protein AVDCRST_MAG47-1425, partial [uncultured Nocardioidaceae bacterium]